VRNHCPILPRFGLDIERALRREDRDPGRRSATSKMVPFARISAVSARTTGPPRCRGKRAPAIHAGCARPGYGEASTHCWCRA
jgi:hypothetical protein